ncbi:MAG: radical SAM protein [Candidatus Helarchaeota archaeon]
MIILSPKSGLNPELKPEDSHLNYNFRLYKQDIYDVLKNSTTKTLVKWVVNGKPYNVYSNVNLSIYSGQICNGNCSFCIEQLRPLSRGRKLESQKTLIEKDNEYFKCLKQVLNAVKPINPSVSITGGEPSKDPRLIKILEYINNFNMRKRTITTNGSGLLDKVGNSDYKVIDFLIRAKMEHLNLSRAHYNEFVNHKIMDLSEFFSNDTLKKIIVRAKKGNIRPRLSCVLLRGYIDSFQEILKYLDWAASIGVDNVVFRQLMKFDQKTHLKNKITEFCNTYFVPLQPLLQCVFQNNKLHNSYFQFIKQVMGYYYYVEVFHYKKPGQNGIDVIFEEADLTYIEIQKQKNLENPIIYELIFHPNGKLCSSWQPWDGIIL